MTRRALTLLLATCVAGCDSAGPAEDPAVQVEAAIRSAIGFLIKPTNPPVAHLVMDVLNRRYDVEEFANLRPIFDLVLRRLDANVENIAADSENHPSYLRVFRRLISPQRVAMDPGTTWEQGAPEILAGNVLSAINVPALYCDQLVLPVDYEAILREGARVGGYELTHVAQALGWMKENGCDAPTDADFEAEVVNDMAKIPNQDEPVTDLELEAAAFLTYMGHADRVTDAFVGVILGSQRPDGAWSVDSSDTEGVSNWHPSVFALWTLLERRSPAKPGVPWVPQAN